MTEQLSLFDVPKQLPVVVVHKWDINTFVTKMNVIYRLCFNCPICDEREAVK